MEAGVCCKKTLAFEALSAAVFSGGDRSLLVGSRSLFGTSPSFSRGSPVSQGILKYAGPKRPKISTVASANSDRSDYKPVASPLEPRSSAGKFLNSVLKNQRHLFSFAAVEQLEQLASERDEAIPRERNSKGSIESCLHGRIAELKDQEFQIAVEEVMYMLIVHKFSEIKVPMVPRLTSFIKNVPAEILASKDRELESVHSLETLEMVREHLSTILAREHLSIVLGRNGKIDISDNWATTRIRRLQLGRLYAASVMYGYFLKSACLRHHLELNLALAHHDIPLTQGFHFPAGEGWNKRSENLAVLDRPGMRTFSCQGVGGGRNSNKLRAFVMEFDAETLQRCAKLNSKEAVNLIEKHTWALFGDDDKGRLDHRDVVSITFLGLKRLVMEAVTFGSFLWDVERYVDTFYRLKENWGADEM